MEHKLPFYFRLFYQNALTKILVNFIISINDISIMDILYDEMKVFFCPELILWI